jgi:transcriptional regulator of NAD metabolism
MVTENRREKIIKMIKKEKGPITGTELAKIFDVSRQVIVQDIAVLRAQGYNILATSNGYMIPETIQDNKKIYSIVCTHEGYDDMEEELTIMIDAGAKVLDVIVEHPVYGEIRVPLMLESRLDISEFMTKVKKYKAYPLASLTRGDHIHTLEVSSDRAYRRILSSLKEKGYLKADDSTTI